MTQQEDQNNFWNQYAIPQEHPHIKCYTAEEKTTLAEVYKQLDQKEIEKHFYVWEIKSFINGIANQGLKILVERFELTLNYKKECKWFVDDNKICEVENEEELTKAWPFCTYGLDKCGRLVTYESLGQFDTSVCFTKENFDKCVALCTENCRRSALLKQSMIMKRHIMCNQVISIVDLKGVSYWNTLQNRSYWAEALKLISNHFPEQLHKSLIINAPTSFCMIWSFICKLPFIDQRTIDKTTILGSDYQKELQKYIDISEIPIEHGGTNEKKKIWGKYINFPKGLFPENFPDKYKGEFKTIKENMNLNVSQKVVEG